MSKVMGSDQSGRTMDYVALKSNRKDWLIRNQDNVSELSDMSTRGMLFQ
jgi:hypothetical protein